MVCVWFVFFCCFDGWMFSGWVFVLTFPACLVFYVECLYFFVSFAFVIYFVDCFGCGGSCCVLQGFVW